MNLKAEQNWLEESLKEMKLQFAIVDLETDKLIGNCGYEDISQIRRTATIGLFIGDEEYRNKGYETQVLKLLLDYGFNYLNFNNIMLYVFSFNVWKKYNLLNI